MILAIGQMKWDIICMIWIRTEKEELLIGEMDNDALTEPVLSLMPYTGKRKGSADL